MRKNNSLIILGIVVMVAVLGVTVYFIATEDSFDERAEATELEQSILELQTENESTEPAPRDCARGDINCDGNISMKDFDLFKQDLESYEQDGWSENLSRSDLNQDQRIDRQDYEIFMEILESSL